MVELRVEDLCYQYTTQPVFSGLSFDVKKGDVVSLVGRNGAGKSTLLQCINHILKPTNGHIIFRGTDIRNLSRIERAKRFGYLSQKSNFLFPSSVFDVVLTGRFPHSPVRFTRQDEKIVAHILHDMELTAFAQRTFDHLSGGEQQQVLIARALAQGADILLFDEPTNNLDLQHQMKVMRLIRKIAKENQISTILAIHDLNCAASFSDKIIMLHEHGIYAAGSPLEIVTVEALSTCFGVRVKIYDHGGIPHIVVVNE